MFEFEIAKTNIRDLRWDCVSDWTRLCPAKTTMLEMGRVTKEDIFRFYELIVREIARKLGHDYKDVRTIMDEENTPFISYVNHIFEKKKTYSIDSVQIHNLKRILLAPQADTSVGYVLRLYRSLSENDQKSFQECIRDE